MPLLIFFHRLDAAIKHTAYRIGITESAISRSYVVLVVAEVIALVYASVLLWNQVQELLRYFPPIHPFVAA